MRSGQIQRKTAETDIDLSLVLDGKGKSDIDTGIGFLDHMLTLFARHGSFDLDVHAKGDINVDFHHTVEDVGICLGMAFKKALGDMRGINRYGDTVIPMDEALVMSAVDISGRAYLEYLLEIPTEKVGDFDCELICEFFAAFVRKAELTLHIRSLAGSNSHHIIEGAFKSFARTMKAAVAVDDRSAGKIPSTKGVL